MDGHRTSTKKSDTAPAILSTPASRPCCVRISALAASLIESFDHLVGAGEERFGNREANRFRGFDVDDQLELGRLHHGNIAGLVALEDPSGIAADVVIRIGQA